MSSIALPNGQNVFVDSSYLRPNYTTYHASYAVVQLPDVILEANSVPFQSAQAAELIALTRACQLFAEQEVNIYTDSKYVQYHGVGHRGWQMTCELLDKDFFIPGLPSLVK